MSASGERRANDTKGIMSGCGTPHPSRDIHGQILRERRAGRLPRRPRYPPPLGAARPARPHRHQVRLRHGAVWRVHRARGPAADALVRDAGIGDRGQARRDDRGHRAHLAGRDRTGGEGGLGGQGVGAVRVLQVGPGDVGGGAAAAEQVAVGCRHRRGHERQHLPLRLLPAHARGDQERRGVAEEGLTMKALSRRRFLKSSAALAGGLVISFWLPGGGARNAFAQAPQPTRVPPNAFLRIGKDGSITVVVKHLEFGQGVTTSLPMILCEELECDWSKVRYELAPAAPEYAHTVFGMQMTGGSSSVSNSWEQLRTVGAQARTMLMQAAAAQWKVKPAEVRAEKGFIVGPGGKKLSYGQLAEAAGKLPVPDQVALKDPKSFTLIGKATRRIDSLEKVEGKAKFGLDVQRKNLHTALVAHPPVFGALVKSFNADKVKRVPGVTHVVELKSGVAVVAQNFWAGEKGRDRLQVDRGLGPGAAISTASMATQFGEIAKTPGKVAKKADNADAMKSAAKTVVAEYHVPFLAHAPMEPLNCTVEVRADGAELWVGSQFQGVDHGAAAKALGIKPEQVKLNTMLACGGFGRRANPVSDYVIESCDVARQVKVPVKVVWTREDDIRRGYYPPSYAHHGQVGLDAQNRIAAWNHTIVGPSIVAGTPFEGMLVQDGIDPTSTEGVADR